MRGKKKAWGSPIALGEMRKRARPAPTSSAQGGRAPLHVVRYAFITLRMKAVCLASPLEPRLHFCAVICVLCICRTAGSGGAGDVIKVIRLFTGKQKNRVPRQARGTRAELAFPAGKSYFLFLSAVSRIKTATAAI